VSKENAAIDLWAKEVAPTKGLRTWFNHRPELFDEFRKRYLMELERNPVATDLADRITKKNVTLVYAAKDPLTNHAVVLAEFLSDVGRRRSISRRSAAAEGQRNRTAQSARQSKKLRD
jgi:uncharacterized protein YeaO (DUF488 family)